MLEKKKILRKIIKVRVSAISADEKAKREKLLLDNLFSMPEFLAANTVMLFANLPDEIGTFSLIDKCIAMGKKVFLPVINGDDMTACEFTGEYRVGRYDIKEPVVKQLGITSEASNLNSESRSKIYFDYAEREKNHGRRLECIQKQMVTSLGNHLPHLNS